MNTTESQPADKHVVLKLFILSFLSLFVELLVIRWMSADVRAFAIFRTFPLITCFVGLGLGFSMAGSPLFGMAIFSMLLFAFTMEFAELRGLNVLSFVSSDPWTFQQVNISNLAPEVLVFQIAILLLLLFGPFVTCVCIGSALGDLFKKLPPLKAYTINLLGALVGSLSFGVLSYVGVAPTILLVASAVALLCFQLQPVKQVPLKLAAIVAIALLPNWNTKDMEPVFVPAVRAAQTKPTQTFWTPYTRMDLRVLERDKQQSKDFLGLEVSINHCHQQFFFNDSDDLSGVEPTLADIITQRRKLYALPFALPKKPEDVLIVGAGTGQNVYPAIAHGAKTVDCVDIDPVVLKIGKQFNTAYSAPQVNQVCDDAGHYIRTCNKKYDLIIFPILDSQTVVGQGSSVRTDSYVYTKQRVEQALKLLKPGGYLVLSFASGNLVWVADRLHKTLAEAAGYEPICVNIAGKFGEAPENTFLLGDHVKAGQVKITEGWKLINIPEVPNNRTLTDDWPFLYLAPNGIDIPYLLVVATVLGLSLFASRKLFFRPTTGHDWQMFCLGAAFLLLELHAISLLALVYGSTWMTSAAVINGILVMILAANMLVVKNSDWLAARMPLLYGLLIGSIVVSYLTPAQAILDSAPDFVGPAAVTLITLLPMFIAGLVFPTAFSRCSDPARAMAFNLFGSVVGGLLEYLSNFTGIKALELVSAGLYLLSFIAIWKGSGAANAQAAPMGADPTL